MVCTRSGRWDFRKCHMFAAFVSLWKWSERCCDTCKSYRVSSVGLLLSLVPSPRAPGSPGRLETAGERRVQPAAAKVLMLHRRCQAGRTAASKRCSKQGQSVPFCWRKVCFYELDSTRMKYFFKANIQLMRVGGFFYFLDFKKWTRWGFVRVAFF